MSMCPLPTELDDLIAGRLDAQRHSALDEHVKTCSRCQAALVALEEPKDPFCSAVRTLASLAVSCESVPFRQEIDRLRSLPRAVDLPFSSHGRDSLVDGTLGDFRIVRQVARGGMGVVYEAQQISLGRRVALKVLSFAGLLDPRRMQRFQNEVRAAASLEHPHIVPVYAVGSDRGVYYYAMRFIDGPNLAEFIEQRRKRQFSGSGASARAGETATMLRSASTIRDAEPATNDAIGSPSRVEVPRNDRTLLASEHIRRVVGLAIDAARALDYAHERGVIHRDIKPSNLMLDAGGVLWIADFGLARIETDPTFSATGEVMGTLRYMSPEQALGKRGVVDHRSDIYSLGVTLYELMTLTYVFSDVPDHVVLAKIASEDPPSPRWLNPSIPVDLETIVLKAMSKEPADRYATAEEFALDLEAFCEHKKIKAQRRGLADRCARWLRRHPAGLGVAATAVIALVVLAAGFATYSALLRRTVRERDESNARLEVANLETASALRESKQAEERADRALQQSRQQIYDQDIEHAARAIAGEDVSLGSNLLDRHLPRQGERDLRGLEWYWLRNRLTGSGRTVGISQKPLYDVAYSPDGLRVATGGADATLYVIDTRTGHELCRVLTAQSEINALVFSPDGKAIATSGDDGTVRLWEAGDGKPRLCISGPKGQHAYSVVFTLDGRQIISVWDDPALRIWNSQTGAAEGELRAPTGTVTQISLAPDGKTLASAGYDSNESAVGTVRLWDLATRQCRRLFNVREGRCLAVAYSPDGKLLATGYFDRTVRVWKCADGTTALAGRMRDRMHDVCFLGDRVAAADGGGAIHLWNVPQKFGPPTAPEFLAHSALVSGQTDESIARWQRHVGAIHRIAPDPRCITVASAGNDGMLSLTNLRPAEGPRVDVPIPSRVYQFQFGPNDELLLTDKGAEGLSGSGPYNAWIYNLETARAEHFGSSNPWRVGAIGLSPDGTAVLLGHQGGRITIHPRNSHAGSEIWDLHWDSRPESPPDRKDLINQLEFAPDGRTLIVRVKDRSGWLRLYDYSTRKQLAEFGTQGGDDPTLLSQSGRWLISKEGHNGSIWDLRSPASSLRRFSSVHSILALAVSPDESLVASGGDGRTIELRSFGTGAVQKELVGHEAFVTSLAFSPEGRSLLSGDLSGTIKIWSVQTGRFLCDLTHLERKIAQIQFSPSGRYLAYSAFVGPLVVYDLHRLQADDAR